MAKIKIERTTAGNIKLNDNVLAKNDVVQLKTPFSEFIVTDNGTVKLSNFTVNKILVVNQPDGDTVKNIEISAVLPDEDQTLNFSELYATFSAINVEPSGSFPESALSITARFFYKGSEVQIEGDQPFSNSKTYHFYVKDGNVTVFSKDDEAKEIED